MATEIDPTLDALLRRHEPAQANLMAVLHEVVHHYGYVPEEVIEPIAEYLGITPPVVYGVMTYYNDFKPSRPAQSIVGLCAGVACRMARMVEIERQFQEAFEVTLGEQSEDNRVELRSFECFGACSLAPLITVDGQYVRNVSDVDLRRIIAELRTATKTPASGELPTSSEGVHTGLG
jgi:bidirectional [NiFe] hydrogenase diaphorase subunit